MMNRNIEQNRRIQEAKIQKQINEAASGVKSKYIFEKIDYVITDQTGYNFSVD
jgi:maltodextrin utilization protein YvdJ